MVEGWHGQTIDHPVAEMREYVEIVRAIVRGDDPPVGEKWSTSFHLAGLDPRPDMPIFIAALSPAMLELAGKIGDGAAMRAAISDGFLAALMAAGDESAVEAGVRCYVEAGVTLPCVGPIPKTDFEATLRAAAP